MSLAGEDGAAGLSTSPLSAAPAPLRLSLPRRVLYALLPTIVLLASVETGLRLRGFEFHDIPVHVRFGPNLADGMERNLFVPDPVLFWRLRIDPDSAPAFARQGIFSPRLAPPAAAAGGGTALPEFVVLGDSCSYFGQPSWPQRLGALLARQGRPAQVWNAAVPGYSSFQGLRLFQTEVAPRRPAWVFLYFGWNDHWLAAREPDQEIARRAPRPGAAGIERAFAGWRTLQAGRALWFRLTTAPPGRRPARVPAEAYRDNLAAICREATSHGSRVALVTAPGRLGPAETARLREGGYAAPGVDLAALHERYNGIAREAAASCGARLVDFAAVADPASLRPDGIHLTPAGIEQLAALVAAAVGAEAAGRAGASANPLPGGEP